MEQSSISLGHLNVHLFILITIQERVSIDKLGRSEYN